MEENELSKARERMKNFDPFDPMTDKGLRSVIFETKYTNKEWQEYASEKEKCKLKGENWKQVRSKKHDEMAVAYAKVNRELENM